MILLDTNVLSALMRTEPDVEVVAWLDELPPESVWTTSTTVFEVRMGLELLDEARRRRRLEEAFGTVLEEDFEGRIAVFDRSSAEAAARVAAERRKAALATGSLRHFEGLGLELVDP